VRQDCRGKPDCASFAGMNRFAVLSLVLSLAACSQQAEEAKVPPPSGNATAATDTPVAGQPSTSAQAAISRYTSLKDCKVVRSGEEAGEDWSESVCNGPGSWLLKVNYGDAREGLELIGPGPKRVTSEPVSAELIAPGVGFNAFGEKVEWRVPGAGDAFDPAALIVRNSVTVDPETGRQESFLLVADLAQWCLVAKVRPGAGQNEQARAIADGPRRACLQD
jgi:hypothetical protein